MRWKTVSAFFFFVFCALLGNITGANAQCAVPNTLTNGQIADATKVMGNFSAVLSCLNSPAPSAQFQLAGPGGGVITQQNPSATTNYNFNFPATAGSVGDLLTSGGGGSNPDTWTSTGTSGHVLPYLDGNNSWSGSNTWSGNNSWTGTQTFSSVLGAVSTQGGTSYALAAADCGTTIVFSNNSPVTLTIGNSLQPGCAVAVEQTGSGQVSIAAGTGATLHSAHGYTKTYGPYAILGLFVDSNVGGSAADIIITGDGA